MQRLIVTSLVLAGLIIGGAQPSQAEPGKVVVVARHGPNWRGTVDGLPVLMLRGTHRERGEAHGRLAGKEIVLSCEQLASMIEKRVPGGWQAATALSKQFQLPKRYAEELQGMLHGIEQSTKRDERMLAVRKRSITFDDLVLLNTADVFEMFRCSQFSAWGKSAENGELIVGRNFDYPPILPRETFCVLAVDPTEPGLQSSLDALFFGFVGCGISAVREDGLFVAPNSGGASPKEILPAEPVAAGYILRTFLETAPPASCVQDLATAAKRQLSLPMLLHVVPPKAELRNQTPVILEFEPNKASPRATVRKPEVGATSLFVANHRVHHGADLARGRCGILKSECEKCLAAGAPINFESARAMLHAARQDNTYIAAVCWPHQRKMKVAIAEPGKVATDSRFYEVQWESIFGAN